MKNLIAIMAATLTLSASASKTIQLQGVDFRADTLAHYYIGPGVTHTALKCVNESGRSFNAYVIALDRNNADRVRVKVDVGNDSCKTAERITAIAQRKTTDSRQYLAAINGDFFITSAFSANHPLGDKILGYPNMSCATDRMLVAPDIIDQVSRENALIVTTDGNMYIDATDLKYRILNNDGSVVLDAYALNFPRYNTEMVVYNRFMGGWTKTDNSGREITLRLADGAEWAINKSVRFIVDTDWKQGGNSQIPDDGIVISLGPDYTDDNIDFLNNLKKGDTVKLKVVCSLPAFDNVKPDISEICGGDVRILNKGVTTTEAIRWINTPSALYSRSLAGYSEDKNTLILCSVDAGGSSGSSGVSYYEAADLMRSLGCYDALDLDGGGSTAIWSHSHGVLNNLRDGSERAVGNGIFITLDAPADKKITSIRFADHVLNLPKYASITPTIYGYNQYGQLVDTDVRGFTLSAPEQLGTTNGPELMASGSGTHALTATIDKLSASIAVTVDENAVAAPRISSVLLDQNTQWPIELVATVGRNVMSVSPKAYSWSSSDSNVASVSEDGTVTPLSNGNATMTGRLGDAELTINVTVQISEKQFYEIADDNTEWTTSLTNVKNPVITPFGSDGGADIEFTVSSSRGPRISILKDMVFWSRPDAVRIVFNPLDSKIKSMVVRLQPANLERPVDYTIPAEKISTAGPNTVEIPLSEITDINDIAAYPLTFKSIAFNANTKTGQYKYRIEALGGVYNNYTQGVGDITVDSDNPGRLSVIVGANSLFLNKIHNKVGVYTLDGRLVASAHDTNTVSAPQNPGLYIVSADGLSAKIVIR